MLAAKVDQNQEQIVRDLRKYGACVTVISSLGRGVPDLLVSYDDIWYVVELKNPMQKKSQQKLTKDEQRWVNKQKARVHVIREIGEILNVFYKARAGKK